MKYYLFIDNFRGFSNTCIPITDVNFLVGQNSTGKTSVMALLKLFSGPRFLMQQGQEFGDEHVSFGHFSDMVSAHSEDQRYFHIGLVWTRPAERHGEEFAVGWLCTYLEDQGLPLLSSYTLCRDSRRMSLRFKGDKVHFKTEAYPTGVAPLDIVGRLIPQWVKEHTSADPGYEKLDAADFPGRLPILMALSMIARAGDRPNTKTDRDFIIPGLDVAFGQDIAWVAPIRTKPRRTYDELTLDFSPEGAHTPYLIRRTLRSKKDAVKFRAFIHKVGKSSGLFQDVQIKNFGKGITAPFEVDIVLDDKALNLSTVGYGVSQALPVLVELLERPSGTWFAIQQPEVHLHPRAQAALGDVIFEMAVGEKKRFLIETHSDFTIDRFRMNYKRLKSKTPNGQILFFERKAKHNIVTALPIGEAGELPEEQPESYREFFIREQMSLLGI